MQEIWMMFDREPQLEISSLGRVRFISTKVLKYIQKTKQGYHFFTVSSYCRGKNGKKYGGRRKYRLHRAVALVFIPNPKNHPQINHIDADKNDNSVLNLEWCTMEHNIAEAKKMGIFKWKPGRVKANRRSI